MQTSRAGFFFKSTLPLAFALTATSSIFTHAARADSIGFSVSENPAGDLKIVVLDDSTLQPISDALITISEVESTPSGSASESAEDTTSFSAFDGSAKIQLKNSQTKALTVLKQGYAALTLVGVSSSQVTAFLKPAPGTTATVTASGTSTGWNKQDWLLGKPVHMGLVIRTLKPADLLQFSPSLLISPLQDTIDVWGKRKIPSNVVAPEQNVPVLIGSVKVNKPDFRLPLPNGQASRMMIAQGQMDSGDLISLVQGGKAGFDALNKVQFNRIGISETLTPAMDLKLNMDANYVLSPVQNVRLSQPPFVSDVMVASVIDFQGDRQHLVPTDIKTPISSKGAQKGTTIKLRSAKGLSDRKAAIFALAITQDYKRFSGIFTDISGETTETGSFMNAEPLADSPQAPTQVTLQAPAKGLAQAVFQTSAPADAAKNYPIWYVYSLPSAGTVSIPTSAMPFQQQVTKYATSRMEFGGVFDERNVDGHTLINHVRRFASSLAEIKKP